MGYRLLYMSSVHSASKLAVANPPLQIVWYIFTPYMCMQSIMQGILAMVKESLKLKMEHYITIHELL